MLTSSTLNALLQILLDVIFCQINDIVYTKTQHVNDLIFWSFANCISKDSTSTLEIQLPYLELSSQKPYFFKREILMGNEPKTLPGKINSKWAISSKSLGFVHSHESCIGKPHTSAIMNDYKSLKLHEKFSYNFCEIRRCHL